MCEWRPASRGSFVIAARATDVRGPCDTQRTIVVLTNHWGVPSLRIRAHQVAKILFSD
jgi:hypothetical protein